jgi:hypothetical protein
MATLATVYNRFFTRDLEESRPASRHADTASRLRPFANEDIFLFVKRIDNTRVVREADPKARGVCWKLIGSVVGAAVLLIGVLLPSAYGLLAGYQIQSLRQEGQRLATEQASLELKETELISPARMEELARLQQFIDPAPAKVVYLDAGSLALNKK